MHNALSIGKCKNGLTICLLKCHLSYFLNPLMRRSIARFFRKGIPFEGISLISEVYTVVFAKKNPITLEVSSEAIRRAAFLSAHN